MIFIHYAPNGMRRAADLSDIFYDRTAILVGGAPSLKEQPIELMEKRGVITMAMNNSAVHFQPTLWVSGDNPHCYDNTILQDPKIMKFGSASHSKIKLNNKYYYQMPNMFFYIPEANIPWDEFLAQRANVPWYHNTLFVGINILYMLGVRRIILAGSDFGAGKNGAMYAHKTTLGSMEKKWNQDLYNSLVRELRMLKPLFKQANLTLLDASKNSRLTHAYEHITLEKAVALCLEDFPASFADSTKLPHCSKFAPIAIQKKIAAWPGYSVIGKPTVTENKETTMKKII